MPFPTLFPSLLLREVSDRADPPLGTHRALIQPAGKRRPLLRVGNSAHTTQNLGDLLEVNKS